MIPVSIKLNLLVLALPIFSLVLISPVGFYIYRESLDASAFSTAVSSLLSAILVILLVWERLRDSLSKKLEYLHKNFLFRLYSVFRTPHLFWTQDETKRLRFDLDKYANFLTLQLYPRRCLNELDQFLALHDKFFKKYREIEELAKEQIERPVDLHRDLLQDYIGLKPEYRQSSYTTEAEEKYKEIAQTIIKGNPQLVSETKNLLEKTRKLTEQIFHQLEDFLKSNNLRFEEEPIHL